jgi:peroxiredoxin Q/BCP
MPTEPATGARSRVLTYGGGIRLESERRPRGADHKRAASARASQTLHGSNAVSDVLKVGEQAPEVTLVSDKGETVSLADFRDQQAVVLYFYPKDDTPGCTKEACSFRDLSAEFAEKGAVILGVSPDDVKSHVKFRDKFSLPFPLLADPGAEVAQKYGVWKEKSMYGKTYMGVERTTVVIGKDGTIKKVFPNVKVDGHVEEVLAAID